MGPRAWIAAALALLPVVACRTTPTSVLLRLEADKPVVVGRLVLTVYDDSGQVTSTRLGTGAVALPSDLVLYPRTASGTLRILARGFEGDATVGEGATSVALTSGAQVTASLRYSLVLLPDGDRDGVPDSIDRCPTEPNPSQQACSGGDGPRDRDAPADLVPGDRRLADLPTAQPDHPKPDLPWPDQKTKPDLPRPDQKQKLDLPKPDLPKADLPPSAACSNGTPAQSFEQGMVGCAGTVTYPNRATLCAVGARVCTASEWVARRGGKTPTHAYWTNDPLHYLGTEPACYVVLTGGNPCADASSPMRVCPPAVPDPLGNTCKWVNCGFNAVTPNQYFGGCTSNPTAGAICCPK